MAKTSGANFWDDPFTPPTTPQDDGEDPFALEAQDDTSHTADVGDPFGVKGWLSALDKGSSPVQTPNAKGGGAGIGAQPGGSKSPATTTFAPASGDPISPYSRPIFRTNSSVGDNGDGGTTAPDDNHQTPVPQQTPDPTPAPEPTPDPTQAPSQSYVKGDGKGKQYLASLLSGKYANNPQEAARQYNLLYGATTGNEAVYDPTRNIVETPFSGYFAGGTGGWQWAQTHAEGPGGQQGPGGNPSAPNFSTVPSGPLTWNQALQFANEHARANPYYGHDLTQDDLNNLLKKFGGQSGGNTTGKDLQQYLDFIDRYQGGDIHSDIPGDQAGLDAYLKNLLDRGSSLLDDYQKPVTADDPYIKGQVSAFHGTSQRQLQDLRTTLAERAHAEGVGSGAFDAELSNADMSAGRDEGSLEAKLMSDENTSRRTALGNMFGMQLGAIGEGDKTQLGNRALTIQDFLGRGNLSNNLKQILGTLSNNRTSIDNQDKQFYDNLSWLMSQYGTSLDSILAGLINH
jgi:hypothetical protein